MYSPRTRVSFVFVCVSLCPLPLWPVPAGEPASLLVASDHVLLRLSAEDGSLAAGEGSWRHLQLPRPGPAALDYNHRWAADRDTGTWAAEGTPARGPQRGHRHVGRRGTPARESQRDTGT